ncbi:MAG TPA: hypothetical protein PLI48_05015 [Gammaproteobacteria bacterium]|nr:hypothetical protein [Gammaproteobacteria bacterium]
MNRRQHFRRMLGAAVAAVTLIGGLAVAADAWREIPYSRLHEAFTTIQPLDDARYIQLRHTVGRADADTADEPLRLVIASASGDIEVPVDTDGTVDFPLSQALLEEDPPVRTNAPEGGLSVGMTIDISAPPTERFPYALLADIEDEYSRMVRKQGLMARMLAPRPAGLEVRFAAGEPGTATVGGRNGRVFQADDQGRLRIPSRREWRRENPEVVLSHMPELISLAVGD